MDDFDKLVYQRLIPAIQGSVEEIIKNVERVNLELIEMINTKNRDGTQEWEVSEEELISRILDIIINLIYDELAKGCEMEEES